MKELIISVSKLSLSTVSTLISVVVRNKILALVVGPTGIGIYSQLANISKLFTAILPIGSIGLTRYTSNYIAEDKVGEINYLIKFFLIRNFFISVLLSLIVIIFSNIISYLLFSNSDFSNLLIIFSLSIPFGLMLNLTDAYFKGLRKINKYVLFLILCSLANLVVNVPLIYFYGVFGAILSLAISTLLNFFIGLIILKRIKLIPNLRKTIKVEQNVIANIYKVGLGGIVALVLQQITFLVIRSNIAAELNLASVGIFQSVYAISINYFGIFFALLATYSIPKFSTFKTKSENNQELNTTLKFLLILYTPLILTIFVFRTFFINILYSEEFLIAKDLLVFQLSGDFFRALSWLFGLWLLPNLKIKQWILFDVVFYVLFYSLFYISLNYSTFGIKSVSIAYLIAYIFHFIINFLYTKFSLDFSYMNKNLKNLCISSIVLAIALLVSEYNEIYGYIIIIPLIVVWTFFVIKKRDFLNLKEILLSKLNK